MTIKHTKALDEVDYTNGQWLQQWLRTQHFRCITWNVLVDLFAEEEG